LEEMLNLGPYRCRVIFNDVLGLPLVFLHGYMFTGDVWRNIGVLELLEEKRIPFIALDMPYGMKSNCSPKTTDPDVNVTVIRDAVHNVFGLAEPVIVGASLGGYISLKYIVRYSVKGLLLVAPVRSLEEDLTRSYRSLRIPVYIIYGSKDRIVPLGEMQELASKMPNAKLVIYEDAEHPAYLDHPDKFMKDLLELYEKALH